MTEETAELLAEDGCGVPDIAPDGRKLLKTRVKRELIGLLACKTRITSIAQKKTAWRLQF